MVSADRARDPLPANPEQRSVDPEFWHRTCRLKSVNQALLPRCRRPKLISARKRILPDPSVCRTQPIHDITDVFECLVDYPRSCPFVLASGPGYLCCRQMASPTPLGSFSGEGMESDA